MRTLPRASLDPTRVGTRDHEPEIQGHETGNQGVSSPVPRIIGTRPKARILGTGRPGLPFEFPILRQRLGGNRKPWFWVQGLNP